MNSCLSLVQPGRQASTAYGVFFLLIEYPSIKGAKDYRRAAINRDLCTHVTFRNRLGAHEEGKYRIKGNFHREVVEYDNETICEIDPDRKNRNENGRGE